MSKNPKTPENPLPTTENVQAEPSTSMDSSVIDGLKAEIAELRGKISDSRECLVLMLQAVSKVENKFKMKFMARGEFYGVNFE